METTILILAVLLGGFVLGSIARVIVPGHQPFSLAETTVIGMVGAAIGAFASNLIQGPDPFERSRSAPRLAVSPARFWFSLWSPGPVTVSGGGNPGPKRPQ